MVRFKNLRLRDRLFAFFFLLLGSVLTFSGIYVDFQLRRVIENEIAQKLIALASLAATDASSTQVLNLMPGDDQSRTAQNIASEMGIFTQNEDISRLLICDRGGRVYYDSQNSLPIGTQYVRLQFDASEIEQIFQDGQSRASKLFKDNAGSEFKAAYAPIRRDQQIVAIVCVEGSAEGLLAVRETRSALLTIGVIAVLIALFFALFVARQVTQPLEKLKRAAESIARGDYQQKIDISGSSEIAFLSQTIDDMRKAIAQRHQQQQMMLAGIAHEIRNPLGGIELFASLLHKKLEGEQKISIEKVLAETRHLKQIVSDFLDFARPATAAKQAVTLVGAVQNARDLVGSAYPHIRWQLELDDALTVYIDPEHLRRILINLFQNACEAIDDKKDGQIVVAAETRQRQILLAIRDNGPGIISEDRDRLFQPFFTTRHQGTGLGLAIVKLLLEENDSSISVGNPGLGCEMVLTLQNGRLKK